MILVNFQQAVLQIKNTVGYFTDINFDFRQMECIRSAMSSIFCAIFWFLSLKPEDGCSIGMFLRFF